MVKLISGQPKWLASLIILIIATLLIGGCSPPNQPPVSQPPVNEPPVNQPPVIESLTSEFEQVKKATPTAIECTAQDPDGDELSYTWSASGGNISGQGRVATWVAPNAFGTYTVTVTVTDGRGGQATESIEIVVTCCPGKTS